MPPSNRWPNNVTKIFPINGTDLPNLIVSSRNNTDNGTRPELPLSNRRVTALTQFFLAILALVIFLGASVLLYKCVRPDCECSHPACIYFRRRERKFSVVTYDANGDPRYRHPEPHPSVLHKLERNVAGAPPSKYVTRIVNENSDPRVCAAAQHAMPGPSGLQMSDFRLSHQPKGGAFKRVAKEENTSRQSLSLQRQMSVRFEQNLSHFPRFSAAELNADVDGYEERRTSIPHLPVDVHHGGYHEDRDHSSGHSGNYRVSNRAGTSRPRHNSSDSSSSKGSSPNGGETFRKDKRGAYAKGEYLDNLPSIPRDSHDLSRKCSCRDSRNGDNINAVKVVEYRSQPCSQDHSDGMLAPLRVVLEYENEPEHPPRRTASTEWSPLEKSLDFWRQEHNRQTQHQQQEETHRSKVRYNDTGSLEEVNMEAAVDYYVEEDVDVEEELDEMTEEEQENERSQYVEIWKLRTTFEEDESEMSDNVAILEANSPSSQQDEECEENQDLALRSSADQSPDPDAGTSHTTSFESNTEPLLGDDPSRWPSHLLQPPSYESRRQNYKSFLTSRLKRMKEPRSGQRQAQMENNSFDSVETVDTEGSSTDASRFEQVTTSFDSTTDNTDSTGDSQAHKLHQTRADSGYKSFETPARPPKLSRKQTHSADSGEMEELMPRNEHEDDLDEGLGGACFTSNPGPSGVTPRVHQSSSYSHRRASTKTASKKRRDYGRDRDSSDQINFETETDSRSGGESYDESIMYTPSTSAAATVVTTTSGGRSTRTVLLPQFFRHAGHRRKSSVYTTAAAAVVVAPPPQVQLPPPPPPPPPSAAMPERDYCVDEKTDTLFREFSRCDPDMEPEPIEPRPRYHYRRLRANHNPELEMVHQRRNKISPQDSIDEEHDEDEDDEDDMQQADIPIIRVADEDSSDPV